MAGRDGQLPGRFMFFGMRLARVALQLAQKQLLTSRTGCWRLAFWHALTFSLLRYDYESLRELPDSSMWKHLLGLPEDKHGASMRGALQVVHVVSSLPGMRL